MKKIELLAPAGDLEKLKIAIDYGADAVYFAGETFGLRAAAGNFSVEDMRRGVSYAHERKKKAYMALNILFHNDDIEKLDGYLDTIKDIDIDAFIISDPGAVSMLREKCPSRAIHLSTQASTTNFRSASFWHEQGIKRIVLARELSLDEIKDVRRRIPDSLELEAFAQGAMCISYSGRCLLSNVMASRDANRGECAHPCRWNYVLMEEQRPGEYMPVWEDERGTHVFNSKDLCMIEYIPQMVEAGIEALKIEGRMKSIFYVASVVGAYRKAIDAYYEHAGAYVFKQEWLRELETVSNRSFTTGFYFGKPDEHSQNYESTIYNRNYTFTGLVKSYDPETKTALIQQRNKMVIGDTIEVFGPFTDYYEQTISHMTSEEDVPIESAPHPQQMIKIKMKKPVAKNFMIRKKTDVK